MELTAVASTLITILLLSCLFLTANPPYELETAPSSLIDHAYSSSRSTPQTLKYILFYNSFWEWWDYKIGFGREPFSQCLVNTCITTSNRSLLSSLSDFDAVLMHGLDYHLDGHERSFVEKWRNPRQRFVFFMLEPPTNYPFLSAGGYNHFWNWTMTYRRDSDIVRPYGVITRKNVFSPSLVEPLQIGNNWPIIYNAKHFAEAFTGREKLAALARRPKKVAWVVSNCNARSKREVFVQELQKYIEVDIFGKCGTASCDVSGAQAGQGNCSETIRRDYKFYLSLENSFAKDYATEKFFVRLADDLLPIVLGQGNYSVIAPPHSYLNVLDYRSPKALADHLHRLDADIADYLSYFWWKEYYRVESDSKRMQHLAFCDLCAKLHREDDASSSKTYPDFGTWWSQEARLDEKLVTLQTMVNRTVVSQTKQQPRMRVKFSD